MKCTECQSESNHLHGVRWNAKLGYIIGKDEYLCHKCANKRVGFKTASQILTILNVKEHESSINARPKNRT